MDQKEKQEWVEGAIADAVSDIADYINRLVQSEMISRTDTNIAQSVRASIECVLRGTA